MAKALWQQAIGYEARLDRQLIEALWSPGVLRGMVVTPITGMKVRITPGMAVVGGDDSTNQGSYLAVFDNQEERTVPARPVSNSRIDILVVKVEDTIDGLGPGNLADLVVVSGVSAATPVAPTLPLTSQEIARWVITSSDTEVNPNALVLGTPASLAGTDEPGVIKMYGGDTCPPGYLWCRGQEELRSLYPRLFKTIAVKFGTGNNTTTFNMPNFQGRMPVGFNTGTNTPAGLPGIWITGVGEGAGIKDAPSIYHRHGMEDHNHGMKGHVHHFNHSHYFDGNTGNESEQHYHTGSNGQPYYVMFNEGNGLGSGVGPYNNFLLQTTTHWNIQNHHHGYAGVTRYVSQAGSTGIGSPEYGSSGNTLGPNDNTTDGASGHYTWYDGVAGTNQNIPPGLSVNFIIKY